MEIPSPSQMNELTPWRLALVGAETPPTATLPALLAAAEAVRESSRVETMLLELRSVHDTLPGLGSLNRTSCSTCAWMGVGTVRQLSSASCVLTTSLRTRMC